MSDKTRSMLPEPSDEARASLKDAARLVRQGVRHTGARLLDGPPVPAPGQRPAGQTPLRGTLRELARSADRLAGRTEERVKAMLWPGRAMGVPAIQPEVMRAVLNGKASEQVLNATVRQMRQWLKFALSQRGQEKAVVLEAPLRPALAALREPSAASPAAAHLARHLLAAPLIRKSSLLRDAHERNDPDRDIRLAIVSVVLAMAAAANRKGRAGQDASGLMKAADAVLNAERLDLTDPSDLLGRFEDIAALL